VSAGAAIRTSRLCKHVGCTGKVVSRNMCDLHYRRWRRANPGITTMAASQQAVLEALPATIPKIVDKTGMCRETVLRTMAVLNVTGPDRQAYIYDWEPPAGKGKNWQAVYRQGGRANKRLTKAEKAAHSLAMEQAWMARRFPHRQPAPAPVPRACWLDTLRAAA
jgi:hypothetical protein